MAVAGQEELPKPNTRDIHKKATPWVALIVLLVPAFLSWFVLMTLWNWFVAPLGPPQLNYWQSAGLSLVVSLLWETSGGAKELDEVTTWYKLHRQAFHGVFRPLIILCVGWLVHWLAHYP